MSDPAAPKSRWLRLSREVATSALSIGVVLVVMHLYTTREVVRGSAPPIAGRSLDGRKVQVPATDGGPRMVHFFATWCGVCKAEEHNVRALTDTGQVVLIASDSGSADAVRAYVSEHDLTIPIVVDDGTLKRAYGVSSYPTSFFVDAQGEIDFVTVGYTTELGMRLRLRATR
jgi:thiol-disulfide isomerase/thioredoxin